ncbi:MAG: glycosyltransferase [Pseudomonadota bacterium]
MALVLPTPSSPAAAGAPAAQVRAHKRWKAGQAHASQQQWPSAAEAFDQARRWQAEPAYAIAAVHAHIKASRPEQALVVAQQLHADHPQVLIGYTLESHALLALGRHESAVRCLEGLPPGVVKDHDAWISLGVSLQRCRRHEEAIQAFMQGLAQKMDNAVAHFRLGMSFKDLGMKAEAAECVRTALALGLGSSELSARGQLVFLEREACRWPQAALAMQELRSALGRTPDHVALETGPFPHAVFVDDPLEQLKVARHYAAHAQASIRPLPRAPAAAAAAPGRRLRLGYASADFHQHATSQLMVQMLECHDRERFEVTLFSTGPDDQSAMRRRVKAACEHFEDLRGFSFERVAQRVRECQIDILIDLKGATHDTLLPVFACRPAPLQVTWLGFPGTTGAAYIDYFIGDAIVTPLAHAGHFSEKIAQMPHCYQPNDAHRAQPVPSPRAQWGVPEGALVLCGFHQSYKISPEVFDVWCRLLQSEPRAVLWLLQWNVNVQRALQAAAAARGIASERLLFAPVVPLQDHLGRLACADVYLDAWPCNAHTTAGEALWMGVPVVTLIGPTFAQRVAASLLTAVKLPQLVCETPAAYEATVMQLLRDAPTRQALRAHLQAQRRQSTLFDGQRFARDFEAVVGRMWQRKLTGQGPEALPAAPAAADAGPAGHPLALQGVGVLSNAPRG